MVDLRAEGPVQARCLRSRDVGDHGDGDRAPAQGSEHEPGIGVDEERIELGLQIRQSGRERAWVAHVEAIEGVSLRQGATPERPDVDLERLGHAQIGRAPFCEITERAEGIERDRSGQTHARRPNEPSTSSTHVSERGSMRKTRKPCASPCAATAIESSTSTSIPNAGGYLTSLRCPASTCWA